MFSFDIFFIWISKVTYLGAFSCEVSWILEAHGDLPIYAYLLCSGYFIMFVASTILIHGLATVNKKPIQIEFKLVVVQKKMFIFV